MGKLFRRLQFLGMLSGLAILGLNFSNPKLQKETLKALQQPLKVQNLKAPAAAPDPEADKALQQKRYVQIHGQLYEYNPRGVYNINGVPTMYKNGEPKTWEDIQTEREQVAAVDAPGEQNQEMPSALSVYTPGGATKLMERAKAAAEAANQRQQEINNFVNE